MKTLVFISALVLLASCDVYVLDPEPVYIDPRDQITGSFDVAEYSSTYDEHWEYGLSIYKTSGDGVSIIIDNFYNSGLRVNARLDQGQIFIPMQLIDGYQIHGSGFISGDKLSLSYNVRDTYDHMSVKDFCNATGWRI
jgi:hypothetical protein